MGQTQTTGKTATTIATDNGTTRVTYHATVVVAFNAATITLNTGGWRTATTKTRMNQTSNQFALGYQVYQSKGAWYVDFNGKTVEFDGDTLQLTR